MSQTIERRTRRTPAAIASLVSSVRETLDPAEIWLFGSRARGDFREDSDWDLLAVLPDSAADSLLDPLVSYEVSRKSAVHVTLLATKLSDLRDIWGMPNTLGFDLSREGVVLVD